uniref:Ubiquitin-like protease family profile domain-containing protein n=1 Tax=Brassica oleracea var. oleracea TaxID=109376 RepID=A0A0D3D3T4_BRAOL
MAETNDLPRRMFALGHEPVGLRVSPYHKPGALGHIIDSLEEGEIEVLKRTHFGKFLELADKTPYSGRLGRYMLSRQLKVRKKYEAWFLFSENPIRFSLRKFAIVTGLPCGKYPKQPQKEAKKMISEQPVLKRKTITDQDARIKYACLAILAYVILPTTHVPKILFEHAEKIRELDEFFVYPWGRVSFEMLMSSIKERDEVALTQSTIALQGYVQSLQMVMTKAVPGLTELVRQDSPTDAAGDDDDNVSGSNSSTFSCLFFAGCNDISCNRITKFMVRVTSIIQPATDFEIKEDCLFFSDDEDDDSIDKMVSLIRDGARFTKKMFIGGATSADVERMREEAEAEALEKKKKKRKTPCQTIPTPTQAAVDAELVASLVQAKIKIQIDRVEGKVDDLRESFDQLQEVVKKHIFENSAQLLVLQNGFKTILDSIASLSSQSHSRSVEDNPMANAPVADSVGSRTQTTIPEPQRTTSRGDADMVNEDTNINQMTSGEDDASVQRHVEEQNVDEDESSDFQLSKAESGNERVSAEDYEPNLDNEAPPIVTEDHQPDAAIPIRKSTRLKAVTKSLVGVYECDKLILNRFREAQLGAINKDAATDYHAKFNKLLHILKTSKSITIGGISVSNKDIIDIAERSRALSFKMIDVLMHHSHVVTLHQPNPRDSCCFLDSKFVSILSKNYSRFSKSPQKEDFVFTPNVLETLCDLESQTFESLRFYLPSNFDKNYWVGICVDSTTWTLIVLDCNASLRSDSVMVKELAPICHMFPYLLKQAGRNMCSKDLKALTVERPRNIPQNIKTTDSGVTTTLLMQAHAVAGIEVCKSLTSDVLDHEAKRLAVMLYEENVGPI